MDKALLLAAVLIILPFVLAYTIVFTGLPQNNPFLTAIMVASFPIGALIVLLKVLQLAKFRFHKVTTFGLFLLLAGMTVLFLSLISTSHPAQLRLLNNTPVQLVAVASIFSGIIIITLKTAIWGSKYINTEPKQNKNH